jgi:hypothetical protein
MAGQVTGPLQGTLVLDLSRALARPHAGMMLAGSVPEQTGGRHAGVFPGLVDESTGLSGQRGAEGEQDDGSPQ